MEVIVAKLGGSIARRRFDRLKGILEELSYAKKIVIVPGGWIFADISRLIDLKIGLEDETSHTLGIMSMEMFAKVLLDVGKEKFKPALLNELVFNRERENRFILLPYSSNMHKLDLPKSWEVTSDSLALWTAKMLKKEYNVKVIKITDVDGIFVNGKLVKKIRAEEVKGCLDPYSLKFIREFEIPVFVCNGIIKNRVKSYILEGQTLGTLVI